MKLIDQLKIQAMYARQADEGAADKPEPVKPAPKRGKPRKAAPNGA